MVINNVEEERVYHVLEFLGHDYVPRLRTY